MWMMLPLLFCSCCGLSCVVCFDDLCFFLYFVFWWDEGILEYFVVLCCVLFAICGYCYVVMCSVLCCLFWWHIVLFCFVPDVFRVLDEMWTFLNILLCCARSLLTMWTLLCVLCFVLCCLFCSWCGRGSLFKYVVVDNDMFFV